LFKTIINYRLLVTVQNCAHVVQVYPKHVSNVTRWTSVSCSYCRSSNKSFILY